MSGYYCRTLIISGHLEIERQFQHKRTKMGWVPSGLQGDQIINVYTFKCSQSAVLVCVNIN